MTSQPGQPPMRSLFAVSIGALHQMLATAAALARGGSRMSKHAALARAITAIDPAGESVRTWRHADATLIEPCWVCLLEDSDAVHMVEVDAHTGAVDHVLSTPVGGGTGTW
jgi:hypothetical protein